MVKDPIVEEIRRARKLLEKEFGSDSEAFLQHIYDQQKKAKIQFRSPKKRLARKAA